MARCPSCNKFAALTEPELEDDSPDPTDNGDGSGTLDVSIVRNSECCGDEMKRADLSLEYDASEAVREHWQDAHPDAEDVEGYGEATVEVEDLEPTERTQTTMVKKGKKRKDGTRGPSKTVRITNYRYMPTFYGAKATIVVRCGQCNEEISREEVSDEVGASGMDESY